MMNVARTVRRIGTTSLRAAYATAAPAPAPPSGLPSYDPQEDPQLAGFNYPKLSTASRQTRNPLGWWDIQERVQFNEPVPENDDIQSMWAPDVHKVKPSSALSQLLLMFSALGAFATGVYYIKADAPGVPRAYPYGGLVKELSGTDDAEYAARPDTANVLED
ncbi:hypothetical protein T439DRAFT_321754 [Meredithblackwellia eburnea MCA 4105]